MPDTVTTKEERAMQEERAYWQSFCDAVGAGWKPVAWTYKSVADIRTGVNRKMEITGAERDAIMQAIERKNSKNA